MRFTVPEKYKLPALFIAFLLIYGSYFCYFGIHGLLPGQIDVWYNLGVLREYANHINHLFFNTPVGMANYPEGHIYLNGEPSFLSGMLFWVLSLLMNDLWAYLAMCALFFTLNSFFLSLYLRRLLNSHLSITFISGLAFSLSAFNLGLLDNFVYGIFFPFFGALLLLEKWCTDRKTAQLLIAVLLLNLEIYFSVYNFFMGYLVLAVWLVVYFPRERKTFAVLALSFISLPLIFPYVYLFILHPSILPEYRDFFTPQIIAGFSFKGADLLRSFQSNPIYGGMVNGGDRLQNYWHMGNIGLVSFAFALAGWALADKKLKWLTGSLIITGMLFCIGPYWGSSQVKAPFYYLHQWLPLLAGFKMIFKFYYLVLLCLVICLTVFVNRVVKLMHHKFRVPVSLLCAIVFLSENLPLNFSEYVLPYSQLQLNKALRENESGSILILPSFAPVSSNTECFVKGRGYEYRYYYLAYHSHINLLNGSSSFVPASRKTVDSLLYQLPMNESLFILRKQFGLTAIVFDKSSTLSCSPYSLEELKTLLNTTYEDSAFALFDLTAQP